MNLRPFLLIIWLLAPCLTLAQAIGGQRLFSFLALPAHARAAALGGPIASATAPDGVYFQTNPALADSLPPNQPAISLTNYLASANCVTVQYGLPIKPKNPETHAVWAVGLQYLTYGQFVLTDPAGNALGTFTAQDYALGLTYARTEGNFSLGATGKIVGSGIETYSALAVMADLGGVWRHPNGRFTVGLSARNAGRLLKNYFGGNRAELPFDLLAGFTVKPRYAPFRLTVTAHDLHRFDIAYNDPAITTTYDLNGNPVPAPTPFVDKLARHVNVGVEFLFSKYVNVILGYNHQRRQEGKTTTLNGLAGFSLGASIRARGVSLTYARTAYAPTAGTSQFSLQLDLGQWMR